MIYTNDYNNNIDNWRVMFCEIVQWRVGDGSLPGRWRIFVVAPINQLFPLTQLDSSSRQKLSHSYPSIREEFFAHWKRVVTHAQRPGRSATLVTRERPFSTPRSCQLILALLTGRPGYNVGNGVTTFVPEFKPHATPSVLTRTYACQTNPLLCFYVDTCDISYVVCYLT